MVDFDNIDPLDISRPNPSLVSLHSSTTTSLQLQPLHTPKTTQWPPPTLEPATPLSLKSNNPLLAFWRHHITLQVPGSSARDHLALERTYLSYHRTAMALSLMSVIVMQLQVLQHSPNPDYTFGFYILGKPLAAALVSCAICVSLLGFVRWWRWQNALVRGRALCGGWEVRVVGVGAFLVLLGLAAAVAAAVVRRTYF
ncbi:hypothetical protein FN846DRAFT_788622 [Sphaerosporella brunnea]|uniref:DUF202 domain-containing protein n=1 Tax=Sphaerosporella brunnea TaxID=1250544 RepID=A0A5J5EC44_9PEZI|nr:hypothetical protein FN846DRAFT_788622 [Sphaerosporella brunnea]